MRTTRSIRRTLIAATFGITLVFSAASPANAALAVSLSPSTGTAGTTVTVIATDCSQDATATVQNTSTTASLKKSDKQAQGTFVIPSDWKPGTYTVEVVCGDGKATSPLVVTSGAGAATGGGSTASDPTAAIALTGAAAVAAALAGLWLLKRRSRVRSA